MGNPNAESPLAQACRLLRHILALLAFLAGSPAMASHYNLPLLDCDLGTYSKCFISAYYDVSNGSKKDWNCQSKTYSKHKGTDFTGVSIRGRSVVAAADGVVLATNDGCANDQNTSTGDTCGGSYGNYVKLRHDGPGHIAFYAHMMFGSIAVAKGQSVKCGDLLGKVASSGNSTGAHLHFDIRPAASSSSNDRFDPFAGSCGNSSSQWKVQNGWAQLPSDDQCAPLPLDDAMLTAETIPDGTTFEPGARFTKSWTFENTGNTTWSAGQGYAFSSIGGTAMAAAMTVDLASAESIAPGASRTFSVEMTAPEAAGTYTHNWRMTKNGVQFGGGAYARIAVAEKNDARLIAETMPDGSALVAGERFTKTWTVENSGNTTWDPRTGHRLALVRGEAMGAATPALLREGESIAPGAQRTFSVEMVAPAMPGTYQATWQMEQLGIGPFGDVLAVEIAVHEPGDAEADDAGALSSEPDAGALDDTNGTAGLPETGTGTVESAFLTSGCGCQQAPSADPCVLLLLALFMGALRSRPRQVPPSSRSRLTHPRQM